MPEIRLDEARFWSRIRRDGRDPRCPARRHRGGIRNLPQVRVERPPRLADFARWLSACEEALGMQQGEAMAACRANSAEARDLALEAWLL